MSIITSYYKKAVVHRYDDEGFIKYFSAEDFCGLRSENYNFYSGKNKLSGKFYYYDGCKNDRLIIFCHGLGGGHRSYMTEINLLCKKGYRVFTYDATGCFESEGESIIALSQFLADLDSAITSLKKDGIYQKFDKIFVIGHSIGGYAAANILNFHKDIDKIVSVSGFVSVYHTLSGFLNVERNILKKLLLARLFKYEKEICPHYAECSLMDIKDSGKTDFLFAHSTDDAMSSYKYGTEYIKKNFKNDRAKYIIYTDRKHNPNYTVDAVNYMNDVLGGFNAAVKEKKLKTPEEKKAYFKDTDWRRMTAQDEDFWAQVTEFLESEE